MRCSWCRQQRPPLILSFPEGLENTLDPHQASRLTPTELYRCNFKRVFIEGGLDSCSSKKKKKKTPVYISTLKFFFPALFLLFSDQLKVRGRFLLHLMPEHCNFDFCTPCSQFHVEEKTIEGVKLSVCRSSNFI